MDISFVLILHILIEFIIFFGSMLLFLNFLNLPDTVLDPVLWYSHILAVIKQEQFLYKFTNSPARIYIPPDKVEVDFDYCDIILNLKKLY